MKFKELPPNTNFTIGDILYSTICPVYRDCCNVRFNARSGLEMVYVDPEAEVDTEFVKRLAEIFTDFKVLKEGDPKMKKFRKVPMNTKCVLDGVVYKRIWADRGEDEYGNVLQINKNTMVMEHSDETGFETVEQSDQVLDETSLTNESLVVSTENDEDDVLNEKDDEIYDGN